MSVVLGTPVRTVFPSVVPAGQTLTYTAKLTDKFGNPVPASALTTFVLTVYVDAPVPGQPLANGIDHVNILNAGRGTIDALGNLTVVLSAADMAFVGSLPLMQEVHVLLLEYTFNAGADAGVHEVAIQVQRIVRA